jgi:hypothetical protein
MYRTLKTVKSLKFPLYQLPSDNWDIIDGIVFVDNMAVDDLNMPGDSIGIRRKQSGRSDFMKLKSPKFLIGEVIKNRTRHFISSDGVPFTYSKTKFQALKFKSIVKFEPRDTYTFVWLHGLTIPLEIPRPPQDSSRLAWARVLYYGDHPWMLFDFSMYRGKNTRIRV